MSVKVINQPSLPNIPWQERPEGCKDVIWRYDANPVIPRDLLPTSNSIFKEMEKVRDRLVSLQDRYSNREDYWWGVFTNLESMMSDLNSQSQYMSGFMM